MTEISKSAHFTEKNDAKIFRIFSVKLPCKDTKILHYDCLTCFW